LDHSRGGIGFNEAGRNTVHAYAMRADFLGESFAEIGERGFGGGISQGRFD